MKIYNTATRKKEDFKPLSSREVKVYYCGPTVYNYAHIGNLRAFVFEDMVVKTLRYLGYNVKTLMNITDVDDKTIRDSLSVGESLSDFTQKYTKIFLSDLEKLNITKADIIEPVTNVIPEMVRMINTMLRRGFAYLADDGSIYYKVSKFKKYGKFAHLDMKNLKESVRIDNDEYDKDNVADFVLWKGWKESDGDNFWEEEFEIVDKKQIIKGRPGWHIECSACNMKHHGAQIDIHMGGVDLIFPHHQNEIAQSEACTRKEYSKYWIHSGHLMVNSKKMAKSANNFYTLSDIEKKYSKIEKGVLYRAIRLSFLAGKYRDSIDFSFDKLDANINSINKIDETIKKLNFFKKTAKSMKISKAFREDMQTVIHQYIEALEDDFNMPEALAVFYNFVKFVNTNMADEGFFTMQESESCLDMFDTFNQVLSIIDFKKGDENEQIPNDINEKLIKRNEAKKSKNFELADKLRDELLSLGYKIIDTREGSRLEKI